MNGLVFIILICAHTQAQQDMEPGEAASVYGIKVEGQKQPIYGFVDESTLDLTDPKPEFITVELDKPWLPKTETQRIRKTMISEIKKEYSRDRETRLNVQAAEAGLVLVNGTYYRIEEVEWADKAREMAGLTGEETGTSPASPQEALNPHPAVPEAPPATAPSASVPRRPWGMEIALVAGAIVLIGVVVKTMLLNG
jgi:hypothetical protein